MVRAKKFQQENLIISRRSTWPSFYYSRSFFHLPPILSNYEHLSLIRQVWDNVWAFLSDASFLSVVGVYGVDHPCFTILY